MAAGSRGGSRSLSWILAAKTFAVSITFIDRTIGLPCPRSKGARM
jgi:hypothetical protein